MPSVAHSRGGLFPSLTSTFPAAAVVALAVVTGRADATQIIEIVTYDASDYSGSIVINGFSNNPIASLEVTNAFEPFRGAFVRWRSPATKSGVVALIEIVPSAAHLSFVF